METLPNHSEERNIDQIDIPKEVEAPIKFNQDNRETRGPSIEPSEEKSSKEIEEEEGEIEEKEKKVRAVDAVEEEENSNLTQNQEEGVDDDESKDKTGGIIEENLPIETSKKEVDLKKTDIPQPQKLLEEGGPQSQESEKEPESDKNLEEDSKKIIEEESQIQEANPAKIIEEPHNTQEKPSKSSQIEEEEHPNSPNPSKAKDQEDSKTKEQNGKIEEEGKKGLSSGKMECEDIELPKEDPPEDKTLVDPSKRSLKRLSPSKSLKGQENEEITKTLKRSKENEKSLQDGEKDVALADDKEGEVNEEGEGGDGNE